jgi:hypothetical protein
MPRKNRYKTLCEAYDKGVSACNEYRRECYEFVNDLRSAVIESLNCPETKVYMFPPSTGFDFKSQQLKGDAFDTEFGENGTAGIGFAINVNNEALEEKFFHFIIVFKKNGNQITFNIDDEKEFVNSHDGINDFCDYLFEVAQKNLANRLAEFLQSPMNTNKPIGFKIEEEGSQKKVSKKL